VRRALKRGALKARAKEGRKLPLLLCLPPLLSGKNSARRLVSSSFSLSFSSSSSFAFFTPRQKKPLFKQPWPTGRRPSTSPSSPSRSVSSRPGKRARVRGGGGRAAGRRETKAKMDSKTRRPKADDDGGERGRVALVLLDEGARFLAAALSGERVRRSALHTSASSASESARPRSQMSEEGRYRRERASAKVVAKKEKNSHLLKRRIFLFFSPAASAASSFET